VAPPTRAAASRTATSSVATASAPPAGAGSIRFDCRCVCDWFSVRFLFYRHDTTRHDRRTVHLVKPITVPRVDLEAGRGLVVGGWGPGQL
jgi:hypothetical protein